jgi:DNA end-binding protein Ku
MTLRFAHEIRREAEYFADIPKMALPEQMANLAGHIVDKMLADFDPALLEDRYRTVLAAKLGEKSAQLPQRLDTTMPSRANVVTLMEVLQRSLAAGQPQKTPRNVPGRRSIAAATKSSQTKRAKARGRRSSR